jgi:hypothetical protein
MSSNWWASKLGGAPAVPSRTDSTPPVYRPANGIRIAAQPPAPPPAYSQQRTVQAPVEEQLPDSGQMHIMDAIKRFRGSRAANAMSVVRFTTHLPSSTWRRDGGDPSTTLYSLWVERTV